MHSGNEDLQEEYGGGSAVSRADEKQQRADIEAVFKMIDTDHDGYISPSEALRVGRMLGIAIPERHTVHVKGVSLPQFLGWITSLSRARDYETEVVRFFTFMKDRAGFITRARLQAWMDDNKIQFTSYELNEMMDMMNSIDDERGICYDDLKNFYEQYRRK